MVVFSIFILLVVGVLAFAYITSVFNHENQKSLIVSGGNSSAGIEQRYQNMLGWLRDLENEYTSGKIDSQDYENQKSELEKEALKILEQKKASVKSNDSEERNVEEMIQNRRMERVERSAGFCVKCGMPLQKSDQFCPSCGTKCK